ncbi:MAG: hypothetical protein M1813_004808 [Trichoglossum hirsutum]|nr:MAG: hypothetical protein M1813_004808 [Trichoglossum hirsutum]
MPPLKMEYLDADFAQSSTGTGKGDARCIRDYGVAFKGKVDSIGDEWESYEGPRLKEIDIMRRHHHTHHSSGNQERTENPRTPTERQETAEDGLRRGNEMLRGRRRKRGMSGDVLRAFEEHHEPKPAPTEVPNAFSTTSQEIDQLRKVGSIADYTTEEDQYPPNTRTNHGELFSGVAGATTFTISGQSTPNPPRGSTSSSTRRVDSNGQIPYGESGRGLPIEPYGRWPEYA